jgi:diacylglycerol O-acyltransferase 1
MLFPSLSLYGDKKIYILGTKWALRFVTLDGHLGQIAYYASHQDTTKPRYVLSLRGCAVRDDGWKRNQRHKRARHDEEGPPLEEPGAFFFMFSIYQRPYSHQNRQNDADIVPLLRFSTPSMAEKTQWIQLISEACAYCETDQWLAEEADRAAEFEKQQRQQMLMATAMPESKEGTLPPLIFAPHTQKAKHSRRPSFIKTPSAANFRTKSKNADIEKLDAKSTKAYPPSKPMHRVSAPSYLSVEAPVQNYRGFFNLGVLILIVANVRLLVGSMKKHGFVLHDFLIHLRDLPHIRRDPWEEFPFVSGFLLQLVFITAAFCIEWLLSRRRIPNSAGMFLHNFNAYAAFFVPMWIVWNFIDKPPVGTSLLLHGTITWMKLISYILANEDYRIGASSNEDESMLALVEDLDENEAGIRYPSNITLTNMLYFWCAPTLTYQIAFPKSPRRRWWKILGIVMRMILCVAIFMFVAAQVVSPSLAGLVEELEASGGTYTVSMVAEHWMRLSIANSYLWLLMFYFYFHLYLNFWAEILRFGDRVFYKDWWNSSEVSAYWRLWNMPVHYWLIRHVYFPCIRLKLNRNAATFIVFLLSAVIHEVLVSIPFHMIRPWTFIGMMMQLPLVAITKIIQKKNPGTSLGNFIFWLSFCLVGQPMAVILYTVDYQYAKHQRDSLFERRLESSESVEQCRVMWEQTCLVR